MKISASIMDLNILVHYMYYMTLSTGFLFFQVLLMFYFHKFIRQLVSDIFMTVNAGFFSDCASACCLAAGSFCLPAFIRLKS